MRVVIQRVSSASVTVEGKITGRIGRGLLVFVGIERGDTEEDSLFLAKKIPRLRIFPDEKGVMNVALAGAGGDILVVSQFTLHASVKGQNRPFYGKSALPEQAIPLYGHFMKALAGETGKPVQAGVFGAHMEVDLLNDGPVTILLDSKNPE
jgi:D-aminoacyl-tRNA deacylase